MKGNCLSCDSRGIYLCKYLETCGDVVNGGEPDGCAAGLEYEEEGDCPGFEPLSLWRRLKLWARYTLELYLYNRLTGRSSTPPAKLVITCAECDAGPFALPGSGAYSRFRAKAELERDKAHKAERLKLGACVREMEITIRQRDRALAELRARLTVAETFRRGPRPAQARLRTISSIAEARKKLGH